MRYLPPSLGFVGKVSYWDAGEFDVRAIAMAGETEAIEHHSKRAIAEVRATPQCSKPYLLGSVAHQINSLL